MKVSKVTSHLKVWREFADSLFAGKQDSIPFSWYQKNMNLSNFSAEMRGEVKLRQKEGKLIVHSTLPRLNICQVSLNFFHFP